MTQVRTRFRPIARAMNWLFCQTIGRKYTGGSTLKSAIKKAKELNEKGVRVILVNLGEHYKHTWQVERTIPEYLNLIDAMKKEGINGSIALKPTQLGLCVEVRAGKRLDRHQQEGYAFESIGDILHYANGFGINVEIDMEDRDDTKFTAQMFRTFIRAFTNIRLMLALQANVGDSKHILEDIIASSVSTPPQGGTRLVKGIYPDTEPGLMTDSDIFGYYKLLVSIALSTPNDFTVALGSHHSGMIQFYLDECRRYGKDAEVQLLYGVRNDLIPQIQEQGAQAAVYLGYGEHAFAYSFRRMRKNPGFFWKIMTTIFRRKYRLEVESDKVHAPTEAKGVDSDKAPTPLEAQVPNFDSDKNEEKLRA